MNISRTTLRAMAAGAAFSVTLALAGCGQGSEDETAPPVEQPGQDAGAEDSTEEPAEETTDDAEDTGAENGGGEDETQDSGTEDGGGAHDVVLAAIELAEQDTGGTAFEVDDGDGGNWEIYVADGEQELEVHIDAEGTEVLNVDEEDSLDSEDRDGLDAATITIAEAIETAVEHSTSQIDDVNLDDDNGTFAWEVAFTDDIEVYVDVAGGEVLRVEED